MKKIITILSAVLLTTTVLAQSPEKMSYQAVIRNASDVLITNQTIGMQISILQGSTSGTAVYVETKTPTTNINGLVSIEIGSGIIVSGTFSSIDWANGVYFIKTETDPTGGTNYTISGTSQLLSVPYALHAKTAESITGGITETDPVFGSSVANGITAGDTTNWNNHFSGEYNDLNNTPTNVSTFTNDAGYLTTFVEIDGSVTNEIQVLSISNDTIYLSDGGFVKLPAGFDGQYSSLTGAPTNVSTFTNDAGYLTTFVEVDGSITNELQALSISNDTIYLSDGGFVILPPANAWSLNGNSGTIDGTNFIGTIDNVPLNFKVNNQKAGRIDAVGSTFYGSQSGNSNTSGIRNTANGYQSLFSNTIGSNNTAVGYNALRLNTSGGQNTALGEATLNKNTIGGLNTALGYASLAENTTGNANSAVGYDALLYNTTGNENTATGTFAMHFNTTGNLNSAVGKSALQSNTTGNNNTAIGYEAGYNNTSGTGNVFMGYRAGYNETGSNKLYIANISTNSPLIYGDFATGNVGLGNNNPSARLHIGNGTRFVASSDASIFLQSGDGAGSARDWKIYVPMTNGYLGFRDMGFDNSNNGMATDAMVIQSGTGNVGIGTTNPTSKLEVQGAVKIVDGSEGIGKVLTSDANGLASWQELPAPAPGTVLQMIVLTSDSISSLNVTSFTEADSSYRISITPKRANSIFLVEYNFSINTALAPNTMFHMQLVRNIGAIETPIGVGPVNGIRNQTTYVSRPNNGYDSNDLQNVYLIAKDTNLDVGTSYTYGFKYRRESGGSGTTYFNYSLMDTSIYGFSGIVTMKITEIAQ